MNFFSQSKIKLILILFFSFCSSQAFGMNWINSILSMCKRQKTETREESKTTSIIPVVRDHEELYKLLYNLLETLPPELLRIILAYDAHKLQGHCVRTIKGSDNCKVQCITELSDERLATGYEDGTVQLWDQEGNMLEKINGDLTDIRNLIQLSNKQLIAAGRKSETIATIPIKSALQLFNVAKQKAQAEQTIDDESYIQQFLIEFSENKLIVASHYNINLINLKTGRIEKTINKSQGFIVNIIKLRNGLLLVSGVHGLEWLDMNKPKIIKHLPKPWCSYGLAELPQGDIVISDRSSIDILNPYNDEVKSLGNHQRTVYNTVVLSNGWIASVDDEGTIKLWDPITHKCNGEIVKGHTGAEIDRLLLLSNGHLASRGCGPVHGYTNEIKIWS